MAKRLSGPERRASIIDAARGLFASQGFHGVSVDEIARAVGVSPAVLYRHFDSKEALYESVLRELAGQREDYVDVVVRSNGQFGTVLRGLTKVFVHSIAQQPDLLKMEMHSVLEGHTATREFFVNRWKTFTDYIEFSLGRMQDAGVIEPVNARAAGLLYQGMLREALLIKCMEASDRFDDMALDELIDELVTLFLHSVGYGHSNKNEEGMEHVGSGS